jgi:hypothetical protein
MLGYAFLILSLSTDPILAPLLATEILPEPFLDLHSLITRDK